jgi:hypothetical protein
MNNQASQNLRKLVAQFLEAPTHNCQTALVAAAEQYREEWIEAQAAEKPASSELADDSAAATRYRRIHFVPGRQPDGTEITLALQARTSKREGHTWYVVSWRTRLGPGGHNRRFYVTDGEAWQLEAHTALDMLSKLEQMGGLDDKYADLERRPEFQVTVSNDVNTAQRAALLSEITMPDESWGENPFFVVLNDPRESWRKILLVNRETGMATFRSTTTDESYMPRKTLRPGARWYLDNSMQDTNVQQAKVLLSELKRVVATTD